LPEAAVLEVFRFALFAVRTFFGVILLILVLYAALWVFVKVHSAAMANVDPDAALQRVMSYNAPAIRHDQKVHDFPAAGKSECGALHTVACARH
jgi:hypothetical protein